MALRDFVYSRIWLRCICRGRVYLGNFYCSKIVTFLRSFSSIHKHHFHNSQIITFILNWYCSFIICDSLFVHSLVQTKCWDPLFFFLFSEIFPFLSHISGYIDVSCHLKRATFSPLSFFIGEPKLVACILVYFIIYSIFPKYVRVSVV